MTAVRRITWQRGVGPLVGAAVLAAAGWLGAQYLWGDDQPPVCAEAVCAIFYEPAGYPMDEAYGTDGSARAEEAWCGYIVPSTQRQYAEQTGYSMDFDCVYHKGERTALYLGSSLANPSDGVCLDGKQGGMVTQGQGLCANAVLRAVEHELGIFQSDIAHRRIMVMLPNGGGWAGGWSDSVPNMTVPPVRSSGVAIIGDWKLTYYLRGTPDPICLEIGGLGSCTDSVLHAPIHEFCHGIGLWGCHNSADACCPSIGYGVMLNAEDIRQYPIYNAGLVTSIEAEGTPGGVVVTPTETPVPPSPVQPTDTPTFTPTETKTPTMVPATKTPKPVPTKCRPWWARKCRR